MKPKPVAQALIAALVAFGVITGACGGDGDGGPTPALEAYVQQVDGLVDQVAERAKELQEELSGRLPPSPSEQEQIDATRPFFSGFLAAMEDFLDNIGDVEPPPEVRSAHDDFAGAAQDFADEIGKIVDQLEEVASQAELETLLSSPAFNEAGEAVEQACLKVEKAAQDREIDVDLNCELE